MEVSNANKTKLGLRYAKHLLDEVGIISKKKQRPITYYALKINELRGDLKITKTKKAAREYLFKLFIDNKGLTR